MQQSSIGIRREDKNAWERRSPLIPEQVGQLIGEQGLSFVVQPSEIRTFSDAEFREVGAEVDDDLSGCPVVLGIKEVPESAFLPRHTYIFFSHVIKGQHHNMPMLRRMMELGCSLIDYEKMTDEAGRRLVFFGRFAGLAGTVDTLAGLGKRLELQGVNTPFSRVRLSHEYGRVDLAKAAVAEVGCDIVEQGLPVELSPFVVGVAGYGHVAKGAWEMLDALGATEVDPVDLPALTAKGDRHAVYRVMFREEHMVEPIEIGHRFDLKEYFGHPELYRSKFEDHLPHLSVLLNCIYWDERYPRLVTKSWLKQAFGDGRRPKLAAIGDVSCDIDGSIEATVKATEPGEPFFVYEPETGAVRDGVEGEGMLLMTVDNLPCELPFDSSREFGVALVPFVPAIARTDFGLPLEKLDLPGPIRRALILHRGKLTPEYSYIEKYLGK
ncbi:MAG: bifunctional lysine ketoglutarate reductase /saccharopine dehydrogenase family protein [candidate division WOR-3 bacterium]|nr:bifunctional lysine ketoglutarate reductase /saccharopine dehydrogenase family protein [candidate division WOR-3 bacterium]